MKNEVPQNQIRVIITPSAESQVPTLGGTQKSERPVAVSREPQNIRFGVKSKIAGIMLMIGIGFGAGIAGQKYLKNDSGPDESAQDSGKAKKDLIDTSSAASGLIQNKREAIQNSKEAAMEDLGGGTQASGETDARITAEETWDSGLVDAQANDAGVDTPEKLGIEIKKQNLQLTAEDFNKLGAEKNRYLRAMILRPEVEIAGNERYNVEDKIRLRWYPLVHQKGVQVQPWEINRPGFADEIFAQRAGARKTIAHKAVVHGTVADEIVPRGAAPHEAGTFREKGKYAEYYNAYIVATFVSVQNPADGAGLKPMGIAPEITWTDDKDPRINYHLGKCKEKPSESKSSWAYIEYKYADGKFKQYNTTFITIDAGQCVTPTYEEKIEE